MDAGRYTFALDLPPDFQRDVLAGRQPTVQLNIDATRMSQAFTGGGYIQQIVQGEVSEFMKGTRATAAPPTAVTRAPATAAFNESTTRTRSTPGAPSAHNESETRKPRTKKNSRSRITKYSITLFHMVLLSPARRFC